jgi:hypothetical protein
VLVPDEAVAAPTAAAGLEAAETADVPAAFEPIELDEGLD